jgi:hypothetical protein
MTATTPRSELAAIGRVLGVEVDQVHGLDGISDDDLSVLHGQIANRLSADKRRRFARVAALSQSIPGPIAGRLAEKFLPPAGGALAAELLEPAKARDLVGRVSVGYLGDLAIALDPVLARDVVRAIPAARVGEVAQELFTRKEYPAMARFVGAVEVDALFATLGVASPRDLLAVVPLLTWNDNLDRVIAELPDAQIRQIADDLDAGELAQLALALDPHRFGPIVAAADIASALLERGEYAAMAGFAGVITPEMLSAAIEQATDHHLAGVLSAVVSGEMWVDFDHLVEGLDDRGSGRLRTVLGAASADDLARLQAVGDAGQLGAEATELVAAAVH